jgi:hypothetical protein
MFGEPRGPVTGTLSKLAYLVHSDQFFELLLIDFGSRGDPNVRGTPRVRLRGPRQNSQFWSILTSFLSYYSLILGPGAIRTFEEPRGMVTGTSSKLADLVHSGCFLCYYLLILGPRVIRTFGQPWGLVTGTSSKLASILTSFFSYYSLILGPGAIRTFGEPPGSGSRDLVQTRRFGPFCPVFCAITH